MENIKALLNNRRNELIKFRQEIEKRFSKLKYKGNPQYRVRISARKNQFYVKMPGPDSKEKYITKNNIEKARQIATYDYLNEMMRIIDTELQQIDRILNSKQKYSPEEYYESLCPARQNLITPVIQTDNQFVKSWLAQPYEQKGFDFNDQTDFRTIKNERVRSKSEIIIANTLERKHVPYKYECPIYLKELGIIHPDFTALNVKRRKIVYWEHLGKMDDEVYARKNTFRINVYQKNGIFVGDNLIVTVETSAMPLDIRLLESLIDHHLLQ